MDHEIGHAFTMSTMIACLHDYFSSLFQLSSFTSSPPSPHLLTSPHLLPSCLFTNFSLELPFQFFSPVTIFLPSLREWWAHTPSLLRSQPSWRGGEQDGEGEEPTHPDTKHVQPKDRSKPRPLKQVEPPVAASKPTLDFGDSNNSGTNNKT